ncbi:thromboxane A2 receptor isoform X2 [Rhincodon typus]|uniref:thromboxane A2 receptor isoform X2 n=1 Tax=Rhincodon typus TaxID=259920 RepID=UPI00202E216B|nr:thromboxane A2 receptor isoform X2 [Rhincodon typus]
MLTITTVRSKFRKISQPIHSSEEVNHILNTMNETIVIPAVCHFTRLSQNSSNSKHASPWFSTAFAAVGLMSNLIAFVVLISAYRKAQSRSRSSFLIFLCGLVVTDFLGLATTASIVVTYHHLDFKWDEVDPQCHLCRFLGFSMVFFGLSPLLLGATMAVERFFGINKPFLRSTNSSKRRAWCTVFIIWLFSFCVALLPICGLGHYTHQWPNSWCFFNMTNSPGDVGFSILFCSVGLLSLAVSVFLNTVSVVTLFKVCFNRLSVERSRDHEVEMMVQLLGIMVIATVCWTPLLVLILKKAFTDTPNGITLKQILVICIRIATWNQILDPWVYILFRRSVLRRFNPSLRARPSISSLYPTINASYSRRFTQVSMATT